MIYVYEVDATNEVAGEYEVGNVHQYVIYASSPIECKGDNALVFNGKAIKTDYKAEKYESLDKARHAQVDKKNMNITTAELLRLTKEINFTELGIIHVEVKRICKFWGPVEYQSFILNDLRKNIDINSLDLGDIESCIDKYADFYLKSLRENHPNMYLIDNFRKIVDKSFEFALKERGVGYAV